MKAPCWSRQGAFYGPSRLQAIEEGALDQPEAPRPIRHTQRFAVEGEPDRHRSMAALIGGRGPATVVGSVVFRVVEAIQCGLRWSRTHIAEEVFKALPAFTDGNASAAVIPIAGLGLVLTAAPHRAPHPIHGSSRRSVDGVQFASQTPATPSIAVGENRALHGMASPARALTTPCDAPPDSFLAHVKDGQASKHLSGQVANRRPHAAKYTAVYLSKRQLWCSA